MITATPALKAKFRELISRRKLVLAVGPFGLPGPPNVANEPRATGDKNVQPVRRVGSLCMLAGVSPNSSDSRKKESPCQHMIDVIDHWSATRRLGTRSDDVRVRQLIAEGLPVVVTGDPQKVDQAQDI